MSKNKFELEQQVRKANIAIFNRKSVECYESNEAIFSRVRQQKIQAILENLSGTGKRDVFLDVGCGTGNVLKLAASLFKVVVGIDIASALLAKLAHVDGQTPFLVGADGAALPFRDGIFDCVSLYAVLHHVVEPVTLLSEAHRVLKHGGGIYIDHDPNYYCSRFVLPVRKLKMRIRPISADLALSEYHHIYTGGLNPFELQKSLENLGFEGINLVFRHSDNQSLGLPVKVGLFMLKFLSKIAPRPSFFTHFFITARKK